MLITSQNLNVLRTGFQALFQGAFNAHEPAWARYAMRVPSTTKKETYGWLNMQRGMREWVGSRVLQNLSESDFSIINKPFEKTVAVNRDDIEDDTLGIYKPLFEMMGQDAKEYPDDLIMPLFRRGFSERCFDGQYFFDADHPVKGKDGKVFSYPNLIPGTDQPWFLMDLTRPMKPFIFQDRKPANFVSKDSEKDDNVFDRKEYVYGVDTRGNGGVGLWQMAFGAKVPLTEESYMEARRRMLEMPREGGGVLNMNPATLVVPPSMEGIARKLLEAELSSSGATNVWRGTAKVDVLPALAVY